MKSLRLAASCSCLVRRTALAAGDARSPRTSWSRGSTRPAHRFDLVGLHWRGDGAVTFRTRAVEGRWSAWRSRARRGSPDAGTTSSARAAGISAAPTGRARRPRSRCAPAGTCAGPRLLRLSPARKSRLRRTSIAGSPLILTRASWGADERIRRRRKPDYADAVRFAVVHHTAGSNSYTRAQSASIVRGIERYHVLANGWDDIGYNFLVDKYGQIFEGRWGGVDRNVVGAHAQGFNNGLLGRRADRQRTTRPRSRRLRGRRWSRSSRGAWTWRTSIRSRPSAGARRGTRRYPAGRMVTLRTISGHRDTGFTTCPGSQLYGELPSIARAVAQTGLPKLYFPKATGAPGGMVRFTGTLTQAMPWSVVVTEPDGNIVASGDGRGHDRRLDVGRAHRPGRQIPVRDRRRARACGPRSASCSGRTRPRR